MSIFTGQRLTDEVFKLDVERMRRGWYSDKYFDNIRKTLTQLAREGYLFKGISPALAARGIDTSDVDVGNIAVEMQWFTRRKPYSLIAGVDKAIAILQHCTGHFDDGNFVNTFDQMEIEAVQDGVIIHYDGDPMNVKPVIRVRGRYRDFALLETPTLGALSRTSRIATNVYNVLKAARGKIVLFFPARFDLHEVQAADGYAYDLAVHRFNMDFGEHLPSFISTDAQGDWWGGAGGGTIAHAAIASFLGDTVETMLAFAATQPPRVPRIALVDFHNNCVRESIAVARAMFTKYRELMRTGQEEEARKYVLFGVRPDTSGNIRDVSVEPLGDPRLDCGVNPRLVFNLRNALDTTWQEWDLPKRWQTEAEKYCHNIKIIVTGGFNPEKITLFERLGAPVNMYGVGSHLLESCGHCGTNNDFTADVVRVKVHGEWYDMAKVGRRASFSTLSRVEANATPP